MRRMRWLPLTAACGVIGFSLSSYGQAPEEFGVLKTTPIAPKAQRTAPAIPPGIEPVTPTRPVATRPSNPYPVAPDAGTWMICAVSYVGDDGITLARQVVEELRGKHRLAAYIYNRGDEERMKLELEHQERQKRYPGVKIPRKTYRIHDQYAVLVGGFKDLDSASEYLPKLKKLPAPTLKLDGNKSPYEVITYQDVDPETKKTVTRAARMHPFHAAMVVRNPTVQGNQSSKPKWDPFWKQLNENEEYSLLKNPKAYTLVVKEYMGARSIQGQESQKSGGFLSALGLGGNKPGEALDAAAAQAHELAKFLRQPALGFTAWVLHTRYSSVVCVGGFDHPNDPECQRLMRMIANMKFATQNGADPIGLLPSPIPVEVPRP